MLFYDLRQNAVEGFVKNLAKLGKHFETRLANVVFPCADGALVNLQSFASSVCDIFFDFLKSFNLEPSLMEVYESIYNRIVQEYY